MAASGDGAPSPGTPATARWSIPLRIEAYSTLEPELIRFLERGGVASGVVFRSQLVVEEIVRNLIEHTPSDASSETVAVELTIEPHAVTVRIDDTRPPFDPFEGPPLDVRAPLGARRAGGMGLHLVRELTDELSYQRTGDHNRLTASIARA